MSMLQAQCDELRAMAVSVGLAVPQAATLMMGAADTIDRIESENAKLREEFNRADVWHSKELAASMSENAKLREMASALRKCLDWESCKGCPMQDKAGWCTRDNRLREMGIEVDE